MSAVLSRLNFVACLLPHRTGQAYTPFMSAGKAVLDAEFSVGDLGLCNDTLTTVIDFIVKVLRVSRARAWGGVLWSLLLLLCNSLLRTEHRGYPCKILRL